MKKLRLRGLPLLSSLSGGAAGFDEANARMRTVFFAFLSSAAVMAAPQKNDRIDLIFSDGKVIKNAKILEADPHAIMVIYQGGATQVVMSDLSTETKARLGYDPQKDKDYIKARAAKREIAVKEAELRDKKEAAKAALLTIISQLPSDNYAKFCQNLAVSVCDRDVEKSISHANSLLNYTQEKEPDGSAEFTAQVQQRIKVSDAIKEEVGKRFDEAKAENDEQAAIAWNRVMATILVEGSGRGMRSAKRNIDPGGQAQGSITSFSEVKSREYSNSPYNNAIHEMALSLAAHQPDEALAAAKSMSRVLAQQSRTGWARTDQARLELCIEHTQAIANKLEILRRNAPTSPSTETWAAALTVMKTVKADLLAQKVEAGQIAR